MCAEFLHRPHFLEAGCISTRQRGKRKLVCLIPRIVKVSLMRTPDTTGTLFRNYDFQSNIAQRVRECGKR